MASLEKIVQELKQQNDTLSGVKESITSMLSEEIKKRKEEERGKYDKEEERREKAKERRKSSGSPSRPSSFTQGFAQGSGISAIGDLLKGFSGVLGAGAATLAGALGLAAGKLFMPVIAGLLGAKYLSQWIKPVTDFIFGEGKVVEIFGKEINVEKIGGAIAGVIGMLLAPTLIKKALKAVFGIGTATGRLILSRVIGKMGIGAAATAAGEAVGDLVREAADKDKVKDNTKKSNRFKRFKQMFKIAGSGLVRLTIPGAIIGSALAATYLMAEYVENNREQMLKDLEEDFRKRMAEIPGLIAAGKMKEALDSLTIGLAESKLVGPPTDDEYNKTYNEIQKIEDSVTRGNALKILEATATTKPPTFELDTQQAREFANIQAEGVIASLDETLIKRIPNLVAFAGMTRQEQEGLVGRIIGDLGLSTSGVDASKLAVDFVKEFNKKYPILPTVDQIGSVPPGVDNPKKPKPSARIFGAAAESWSKLEEEFTDSPKINATPAETGSTISGGTGMNFRAATESWSSIASAGPMMLAAAAEIKEATAILASFSRTGGHKPGSGMGMLMQFNPSYDHNYNRIEYGIAGGGSNITSTITSVR